MSAIFDQLAEYGIMPLLTLSDAREAVPLGQALCDGGIPIAVISCRTEAAGEAIRRMARACPGMLLGAGAVRDLRQIREAVDGGACFVFTQGFSPEVVGCCQRQGIAVLPGAVVPADLGAASERGLSCVGFPVTGLQHGADTLRGLIASCPALRFVPSGGISPDCLQDYLDLPAVAAVASSCIPPHRMIAEHDWTGIARLCRHVMCRIFDFRISHVGLQDAPSPEAGGGCRAMAPAAQPDPAAPAGCGRRDDEGRLPAGSTQPLGSICVETRDMERALAMFRRTGVHIEEGSEDRDGQGRVTSIRIHDDAGGFIFRLRQRRLSA